MSLAYNSAELHGLLDAEDGHEEFKLRGTRGRLFSVRHVVLAYGAGILSVVFFRLALRNELLHPHLRPSAGYQESPAAVDLLSVVVRPGGTESHRYPPSSPTNAFPSLFPSDVGYAGPTPTGAEPALVATAPAYPVHSGAPHLLSPEVLKNDTKSSFDIFTHWGNLSPWFTVDRNAFGVDSSIDPPSGCRITGLHLLHRHGARYPTGSAGGPADLAARLHNTTAQWKAHGALHFLNDWTYKLGQEILTPFGRQQLYDLGVSMRMKYGFLLQDFTASNTIPVFRTESQDRMLSSALNFALGFFGYPLDHKYQQLITIENHGFNNTLAPSKTCPNSRDEHQGQRSAPFVREWASLYLKDTLARLRPLITNFDLELEDIYRMQQLCAYETIALGYSKFCELFTEEEWQGFDYSVDLNFWYDHAFGSPLARAQGIGYVQELLARLTNTPITEHNSTTNSTIADNPTTFPLGQSLYVDATHDTVVLYVITALNLTSFAADGPLPTDHIPKDRSFKTSHLVPFATNVQFQLLSCDWAEESQLRIIINDGVAPLSGIRGCPAGDEHGMCPVSTFVAAQREIISKTDWAWACLGDWEVPVGHEWNTTTGEPPAKP